MSDRLRVVFMGTPGLSVRVLERLLGSRHPVVGVLTRPDKPKGRGLSESPSPVRDYAARAGLRVLCPENLRSPQFLEAFLELSPDLLVGAAFGALVPREMLEIPALGAINLHPSLLPRYRGAAPVQRAIMSGETTTGVTIHFIEEGLDTGDIIIQEEVPLGQHDTAGTLSEHLFDRGAELLLEVLELFSARDVPRTPQDETRATYAPKIERHEEALNWTRPASEVLDTIRALNPYPGAYARFRGRRFKVWRGKLTHTEAPSKPGQVLSLEKQEGFVVAASPGSVLVEEVQPEGKRVMSAWDFCMGRRIKEGDSLDTQRGRR